MMHAHGLLDEETISAFVTFCTRKMEDVIDPWEILDGKKDVPERLEKLMNRDEPRIDILGVICGRLYAVVVQDDCDPTKERINNFQKFITNEVIPEDMRHSLCFRIVADKDVNVKNQKWVLDNEVLKKQIMSMLR